MFYIRAVILILLLGLPVSAYLPRQVITPAGVAFEKWADSAFPITWRLNPSGGANISGARSIQDAIRAAFASWNAVSTAAVSFAEGAVINSSAAVLDGNNVIAVSPAALTGGAASLTVLYSYSAVGTDPLGRAILFPGQIVEADILFSPSVQFSTDAAAVPDRIHLESRARHEVGHLLGLDHSGLLSAAMFTALEAGVVRPLALDDEIGVSILYPAASFLTSRGTIRGTVKTAAGAAVFGAHVVAVDADGKAVASTLTRPEGEYQIPGLPPGSYQAYAEPLDRPLQTADIETLGRIFPNQTVNQNFTTRFAVTASSSAANLNLTKTAGDNQTGLAGQALTSQLEVEVRENNVLKPGVLVAFRASSGGGVVVPVEAITDGQGKARTKAYLGAGPNQTFTASASSATATFAVTVQPPTVSSITFLDSLTNAITKEIVVNEGGTTPVRLRVFDSAGTARTDVTPSYTSSNPDVATVGASGVVEGKKAGFSTLTATASGVVSTATITVVQINAGTGTTEVAGVVQDLSERLYLAASLNHTILVADGLGQSPATYAGIHQTPGFLNAARLQSQFKNPAFLALNQADGSLFVSDGANNVIRRVLPGPGGVVETFAGSGAAGSLDGAAATATFNNPQGLTLDNAGNLWVVDSGNHAIRRINLATRVVETIAGKAGISGSTDGIKDQAAFNAPVGIALDAESLSQQFQRFVAGTAPAPVRVVVSDTGNGILRRVAADGRVDTIVEGSASAVALVEDEKSRSSFPLAGSPLSFDSPTGLAIDPFGNIYLTEPATGEIKVLLTNGTVVRAAPANTFVRPKGLGVTRSGKVIVAAGNSPAREIVYGQPEITSISPAAISNKGATQVTVRGKNFAPGTGIVVAGVVVSNVDVRDTETAVFTAPPLPSGRTTLTVFNRAGLAQTALLVAPTSLSELAGGQITTIAGGSTFAGDGSRAAGAFLDTPQGVALDSSGNLYVADRGNFRIRKIDPKTGVVTTIAGTGREASATVNVLATTSPFSFPEAVAVDSKGNVYIAEPGAIYKVDAKTGILTRIVTGTSISYIALDPDDNLYYAALFPTRILKLPAGSTTPVTFAGGGSAFADGGPATQTSLSEPQGIASDRFGNIYIAERTRFRIRKVDKNGIITTVVGDVSCCPDGDGGPAINASVREPEAITLDGDGNLYIADQKDGAVHRIRKVDAATGNISTLATFSSDLNPGLIGISYEFRKYMAADASGGLYVAITFGHQIARIDTKTGAMTIVAGTGAPFIGDGLLAAEAAFVQPYGISFDRNRNLFVADRAANRVRRIDGITGKTSTVIGNGKYGSTVDRQLAAQSPVGFPEGVASDGAGNVFVRSSSDIVVVGPGTTRQRIARVDGQTGLISILLVPTGGSLASGPTGDIYIGTGFDGLIRRYQSDTGLMTVIAGGGSGTGDNLQATEVSMYPSSLAVDSAENIFVVTAFNRVRRIDKNTGNTTIVVPQTSLFIDNLAPNTLAVDRDGNLYILEAGQIRRVDAQTGAVTTIATLFPGRTFKDNVAASDGGLDDVAGIAVDDEGNIYVADATHRRIRAIRKPGAIVGATPPESPAPTLSSISSPSIAAGSSVALTLTGTNFQAGKTGVSANTTEIAIDDVAVINATSLTARFTVAATAATGSRNVTVTTPGGTSGPVSLSVTAPSQPLCTAIAVNTSVNGAIATSDLPSRLRGRFSDCFTFSATAGDRIVVSMNSQEFDSYLYLLDANAQPLASDDQGGGANNARIPSTGTFLLPSTGTYTIEATAFGPPNTGAYSLALSLVPALTGISPSSAMAGATVTITLTGARFVENGTTVNVSGSGITVSNVSVSSPASLTAGFAVALTAATGARSVTVTTSAGTSAAVTFTVNPALSPQATVHSTIPLTGRQLTALGVYEAGNKLYVADDDSGNLLVIDGNTHATLNTISVGSSVFDIVVNETYGKVYAASSKSASIGLTSGNGLISVINGSSNQLITQINPGHQGAVSYFLLANDETHDKIYVAFFSGIGVIDVATDQFTLISAAPYPYPYLSQIGINRQTNEIYLAHYANNQLVIINGTTLAVQTVSFPSGSSKPLDIAVNETQNKVYVTMITVPGQATMGIAIYDRAANQFTFRGSDDLEPLAFNPSSNRLYTGVQVGQKAAVIDGVTDAIRTIDLGGSGIAATAVRFSTDNAYHANQASTFVVNGSITGVQKLSTGNVAPRGGLIATSLAINQTTGRVYVVNDDTGAQVKVLQDVASPQP